MESIKIKSMSSSFAVYNAFVDKYMKDANAAFVKVYLFILRHSSSGNEISLDSIASGCDLLKSDVVSALKYWANKNVISYENAQVCILHLCDDEKSDDELNAEASKSSLVVLRDEKKHYPTNSYSSNYKASEVIKTVASNESLAHLFVIIGQLLNKNLNANDYKIIYGFIDHLQLPEQVVIILFEYCVSIKKTSMRYIEQVAISWSDSGINTPELAIEYVRRLTGEKSVLTEYKKKFKISGREFSDTEEKMLLSWINELKADDELIMKAYDITVLNTGKVLFKYMDAIIRDEITHKDSKNVKPLSSNVKKSSFRNYPDDDKIGDIEKKMIEKMMSQYGGDSNADNE